MINREEEEEKYWLALLNKGDKNALEFFYRKYYNLLYNYGLKFCSDSELIKDFIQDVFYKLYKSSTNSQIQNLRTYLLKSMQYAIYDHYASQKKTFPIDEMDFSFPENDAVFNSIFTEDDVHIKKWKSVLKSIQSLPNQQKQILYLFYVKGLTHKEIAEILNIRPQSSMNSIHKSLKKIRLLLNDDELILLVPLIFY